MNLIRVLKRLIVVFIIMLFINSYSYASSPLKVGIVVVGAPISEIISTDQGRNYFGFCIDLMDTICSRIEKTCTYKETSYDNQFELLDSGQIDLLILARPYNSYDLHQYAISIPYSVSKILFITSKDSPIDKIEDIKNKKIGVLKSTFYDLLVKSHYHTHNQIIAYNLISDLIGDLMQHKIDVIVLNNYFAYGLLNNNLYSIKSVEHGVPLGDGYGIIALSDKAALIEEINKAILNMQRDGTFTSIYRKYYTH